MLLSDIILSSEPLKFAFVLTLLKVPVNSYGHVGTCGDDDHLPYWGTSTGH